MGRYRGPSCKICRRNGEKLFLKGSRCETAKCEIEKRNFPPGPRPVGFGRKLSEYGRRLREKQKLRFFYGVSEGSIRRYYKEATRLKGVKGHNLLILFERRLDNVIYRAGLAESRKEARQLVRHNHFRLNDKKSNVPSMLINEKDVITVQGKSLETFKPKMAKVKEKGLPEWISFDEKSNLVQISSIPTRDQIDTPVNEQLIVEFYSR